MSISILPVPFPYKFRSVRSFISTSSCGNAKSYRQRKIIAAELNLEFNKITTCEQVHGNNISIVKKEDEGKQFPAADGLITRLRNVPIAIFVADCLPIFLYDPEIGAIGLVHAGRRGTGGKIIRHAVDKLRKFFSVEPENICVSMGPCICKKCYPVDLIGINCRQLEKSGIKKKNIHIMDMCTFEDSRFFSYRREKTNKRLIALIIKG